MPHLAAGAVRSFWVRTRQGGLSEAMPRIRKEIARAENVLIESNSILRFLRPDLYLSVLDPETADFKESARYFLDRADAVLVAEGELGRPEWKGVSLKLVEGTPILPIGLEASTRSRMASLPHSASAKRVLIKPGATALTRTLLPSSRASCRVSMITPALVTL